MMSLFIAQTDQLLTSTGTPEDSKGKSGHERPRLMISNAMTQDGHHDTQLL